MVAGGQQVWPFKHATGLDLLALSRGYAKAGHDREELRDDELIHGA